MYQLHFKKVFYRASFLKFSQTLANIQQNSSTNKKIQILSDYIKKLNDTQKQQAKSILDFVNKKISTGVSNKILITHCCDYYGVSLLKPDQQKQQADKIVQNFIPKHQSSNNLSLKQINLLLKTLPQTIGKEAINYKMKYIFETLRMCSFIQSRFVLRILIKDMKIGMHTRLVEKAFQEAIKLQNNVSFSFDTKSFNPMLARPLRDIQQFQKFCSKKPPQIVADVKYDGQRTLITYLRGEKVVLISRNGKQQNQKYFSVAQQLQTLFDNKQGLDNITIDAEILAIDRYTKQPLPFQVLLTRRRKIDSTLPSNDDEKIEQIVYAFDVIEYNGKTLYEAPLMERRKLLFEDKLLKKSQCEIFKYPEEKQKLMNYFHFIVKRKYEGLILKGVDDFYYTNGTRIHWGKLKKGFRQKKQDKGLIDLDLIVMGGDFGRGRKQMYLSSYLLGMRDGDKIVPISRVGSGFADQQLDQLTENFKKITTKSPDSRYQIPQNIKVDVWFQPRQVVEVDCQQFTRSPMYTFGYKENYGGISLRFPVFKRLRTDKNIEQATQASTILQQMLKQQTRKK